MRKICKHAMLHGKNNVAFFIIITEFGHNHSQTIPSILHIFMQSRFWSRFTDAHRIRCMKLPSDDLNRNHTPTVEQLRTEAKKITPASRYTVSMKPVLVCLHGWGGSKESFTEL